MNRAGLLVVIVALVLAVVSAWTPAEAKSGQEGNVAAARMIDASVKSAPLLSEAARGQGRLDTLLANRDVHVVNVGQLVDAGQADVVNDLLSSSDVLSQQILLLQTVAREGGPLSQLLEAHDIPVDQVMAVALTEDTAAPVTVYLFERS